MPLGFGSFTDATVTDRILAYSHLIWYVCIFYTYIVMIHAVVNFIHRRSFPFRKFNPDSVHQHGFPAAFKNALHGSVVRFNRNYSYAPIELRKIVDRIENKQQSFSTDLFEYFLRTHCTASGVDRNIFNLP